MSDVNLYNWLRDESEKFLTDASYYPQQVMSQYGLHGCTYGVDEDDCKFVTIGFNMPPHVFAEIEEGTWGNLQGWRIYYDPADQGKPDVEISQAEVLAAAKEANIPPRVARQALKVAYDIRKQRGK